MTNQTELERLLDKLVDVCKPSEIIKAESAKQAILAHVAELQQESMLKVL